MKICLDAGHAGKYNRSPANPAYYESDAMWKLHLLQKKYLEAYGVEVILTRPNQATDKEVYARGTTAKGCDLFISDHSNAVGNSGTNETVDYPVVYVPISGKGNSIGEKLAECVASVMGTTQKGRIATREGNSGDYYGVIRGAVAVGVVGILIEHSFHTNTKTTNWLLNDDNLDKLAKAEADVIAKHYGLTASTPEPATPTTKGTPIMGSAVATAEKMAAYLISKNAASKDYAAEYARIFISEGINEGVRGDVAFAQSCLETGNFKFGGDVKPEQNNFAGIGATGGGVPGNCFTTPQEGIRAQIQHLKAYASTTALNSPCVDPRFQYVTRGCAEFVEWLGQKENPNGKGWAAGADYGAKVITILNAIIGVTVEQPKPDPEPSSPSTGFKVGEIVQFTSGAVYKSSNAATPEHSRGKSRCKVTQTYNGKHPYHLISEDGGGVYGWVDAIDVSAIGNSPSTPSKSIEELAKEVINGKWGNGQERKEKLTAAGYDYNAVQAKVNALLK